MHDNLVSDKANNTAIIIYGIQYSFPPLSDGPSGDLSPLLWPLFFNASTAPPYLRTCDKRPPLYCIMQLYFDGFKLHFPSLYATEVIFIHCKIWDIFFQQKCQ